MVVFLSSLLLDLVCTPLLLIWPQYSSSLNLLLWALDFVWLVSIGLQFITVRYEIISRDTFEIILHYLKSEFLFDCVATIPTMISNHSQVILILRLLHVIQVKRFKYFLDYISWFCFPQSRNNRIHLEILLTIAGILLLSAHYFVCLWIHVGDRYLLGD
jgi:hypothetical protein